jgi:hypothetical protein
MNEELERLGDPITQWDLFFLLTLCIIALQHPGHIHVIQLEPFGIDFGDVCEEKGLLGGTIQTENGQGVLINPKIDKSKLLTTIAHEAVHLIQFMKGNTKRTQGRGVIEWMGKLHKILTPNDPAYDDQPWEEEAYRLTPQIIDYLHSVPKDEMVKLREDLLASPKTGQ